MDQQLTSRQMHVLESLQQFVDERGRAPSYRELADASDYKSVSDVCRVLKVLRTLGYVQFEDGKPRTVCLTGKGPGEAA